MASARSARTGYGNMSELGAFQTTVEYLDKEGLERARGKSGAKQQSALWRQCRGIGVDSSSRACHKQPLQLLHCSEHGASNINCNLTLQEGCLESGVCSKRAK